MTAFSRIGSLCVVVLWATLGITAQATAQTPRFELSAAYVTPYDHLIQRWFPVGWNVDGAAVLSDRWSVVGEAGAARRSESDFGVDLTVQTMAGGTRLSFRRSRFVPFVQMLAGAARTGTRARLAGHDLRQTQTNGMIQSGGGLAIGLIGRWSALMQADYRRIFLRHEDSRPDLNEVRIGAGVRAMF